MTGASEDTSTRSDREQLESEQAVGLLSEFVLFAKQNKKWWLVPIAGMLLVLGVLIVLSESSAIAPFIYTLF